MKAKTRVRSAHDITSLYRGTFERNPEGIYKLFELATRQSRAADSADFSPRPEAGRFEKIHGLIHTIMQPKASEPGELQDSSPAKIRPHHPGRIAVS